MISVEEQQKRELTYLASFIIIRNLYLKDKIDVEILKRLNNKNAETMGCLPLDFIHYN